MVEYFIIDKKITLKDISSYRDKANKMSVENCLLIANMFDISLNKRSSISDMKVKEEDYLYLDDPSKIKIKNMIKSKFLSAINDVMLPLVNLDFNQPMRSGKNIFYISIDDKLIIGSAKSTIYSGYSSKYDLSDDISSIILIKKFLLY